MNPKLLFRMMWRRMARYKLKSFFMMLGIIVSVLATILLLTVGAAIRDAFVSFIKYNYSSDTITVVAGSGFGGDGGASYLTLDELRTVANSIGDITAWEPFLSSGYREIKNQGANLSSRLTSSSDQARYTTNRGVQEGDFFTAEEVRSRARVALLGSKTAEELFGHGFPVGETIFIDNVPYEIKGILEDVGFDPHGNDQDYAIRIPYTTLMDQLKVNYVSGGRFLVADTGRLEAVEAEITRILRELHHIDEDEEDDFSVLTAGKLLAMATADVFDTLDTFLPLISIVAFFVSGVVILSIMLISVRERTPEIGLRKALGARPADLRLQFLLEVSLLSIVGAALGVALALPLARLISPILETKFGAPELVPSAGVVLLSVVAAVAAGAIAGYLPAVRASKLHPVDALR